MRIFSVGGADHYATGGEAYTTFLNEPHSTGNQSQGYGEIFWIQIEFTNPEGFLGLSSPWDKIMYNRLLAFNRRKVKLDKFNSKILEQAINFFVSDSEVEKSIAHINLLSFINSVLDSNNSSESVLTDDIHAAVNYIKSNIYEDIKFEDLSKISGLSISGLKYKFCEQVGMPPMQYVNYIKIEEAKRLIEQGEKMVEISEKLGFSSNSHFSYVFKKIMGITPTKYKTRVEENLRNQAGWRKRIRIGNVNN
jgi:AraC-like DNA-binding protein